MARLTEQTKTLILADYHTGDYSQRKLAEKHNVSIGTINKLTKEIDPKNEHLVNAQTTILKAQSILPNEQMNAIMNTANDKARRANLVFGVIENAVKKNNEILEHGYVEDKLNVGDGMQKFDDRKINPKEVKEIMDSSISAGKAFGIIEEKPSVQIANQNNQTNEIVGYGVKTIGD